MEEAFYLLEKLPGVIPLSGGSYLTPSPYSSRQKKSCNPSDLVQLLC